jgi:hypothetical protein
VRSVELWQAGYKEIGDEMAGLDPAFDVAGYQHYWDKKFGSWGQTVKDSDSWESDDVDLTIVALQGTGQNFCIYDINTDSQWNDFLKLLESAKTAGVEVFAAMDSPSIAVNDNRWFDCGFPSECTVGSDECKHLTDVAEGRTTAGDLLEPDWGAKRDCDRNRILTFLKAWKRAAEVLSALSLYYTNLKGFLINDFHCVESVDEPTCLFGDNLTHDEVKEIADACASVNPNFGFWPVFGITHLGRVVGKSHILGHNYGVTMQKGEYASVVSGS